MDEDPRERRLRVNAGARGPGGALERVGLWRTRWSRRRSTASSSPAGSRTDARLADGDRLEVLAPMQGG